jgi:hypothetical protein
MKRAPGWQEEILERVHPLIDRISDFLVGTNVALASYALANLLVTCWRKTGLTRDDLHEVIDEIFVAAEVVAAETRAEKN